MGTMGQLNQGHTLVTRVSIVNSAVFVGAVLFLLGLLAPGPAEALEFFVDPESGTDSGDRGSVESPYRSLSRALANAADGTEEMVTIHLSPGVYSQDTGETFPLRVPLALAGRGLRILGSAADRPVFQSPTTSSTFVRVLGTDRGSVVSSEASVAPTVFDFRNVTFRGGAAALSIVGGEYQAMKVNVEGCEFRDQKVHGLEVVSGGGGSAVVNVSASLFSGGAVTGLDLATLPFSSLDVNVRDNSFVGNADTPSLPLRAGIGVFLDEGASIAGVLEKNDIRGVGEGILIGSSDVWTPNGTLNLNIRGNYISGVDSDGLRHGIYLSIRQQHHLHLEVTHNTLAFGSGNGVYFEDVDQNWMAQLCDSEALVFLGNVIWKFDGMDFSLEEDPNFESPSSPESSVVDAMARCFTIENNGLSRSKLVDRDNFQLGEGDLVLDGGENGLSRFFRPSPGATAILDNSQVSFDDPRNTTDLTGACRVADGDRDGESQADLGATERLGDRCYGTFVRSNCDMTTGEPDFSDAIVLLRHLFLGAFGLKCLDACDANDDGRADMTDAIYVLRFLFLGVQAAPPAPFPEPGSDPTEDFDELGPCET